MQHGNGAGGADEPDPDLTPAHAGNAAASHETSIWPFVGSVAMPVAFLTVSVIDGTHAIWAQITSVVLVMVVVCATVLAYRWWARYARLRLVPAAVVIACFAGTLAVMIVGNVEPPAVGGGGSTTAAPPQTSSPPPSSSRSTQHPTTTSVVVGCWAANRTPIDCREPHRLERIEPNPACDRAAVVRFLGGSAIVDVVTAAPVAAPGGGCALQSTADVSGSARDVLQSRSSAVWRRCFDRRTSSTVNCSQLHSSEYVATGSSRRATVDECLAAATTYLDQLPANLMDDLSVSVLPVVSGTPDPARCAIEARGNHLLTDTVRSLGSRPVPVQTT